jgi:hypothetical protein
MMKGGVVSLFGGCAGASTYEHRGSNGVGGHQTSELQDKFWWPDALRLVFVNRYL